VRTKSICFRVHVLAKQNVFQVINFNINSVILKALFGNTACTSLLTARSDVVILYEYVFYTDLIAVKNNYRDIN